MLALATKANADQKINNISKSKEQSDELLSEISEMSATMQNGISEVYADLEKLQESSKITQSTMTYPTVQLIQPMPYRTSLHRQMQFRKKLNL